MGSFFGIILLVFGLPPIMCLILGPGEPGDLTTAIRMGKILTNENIKEEVVLN